MALFDATFTVEFGVNNYGKDIEDAERNLVDSLPADVRDALDVLSNSGWVDVSWGFEWVDPAGFRADFLTPKRGEED